MPIRCRSLTVLLAASAFALAGGGPAQAESRLEFAPPPASHELPTGGTLLTYTADATEAPQVALSQTATDLVVSAPTAKALVVGDPCVSASATTARCPLDFAVERRFVLATPAGGAPRPLTLDAAPGVTVPLYAQGTPGQPDVLHGGDGRDILIVGEGGTADGGPGDDHLLGTENQHVGTLIGGEGNDRLEFGADVRGGPGNDKIDTSLAADGGPGDDFLTFVQQGTGGDGRDDLVGASYTGAQQLDGGPGADSLQGGGASAVIHGGDGDDRLDECSVNCSGGAATLFGDAGNDTMTGASRGATLDGGDGDDAINLIMGGAVPGNTVLAGAGADTVKAKQGAIDTVDCGDGLDTVSHDAGDRITACETDLDPLMLPKLPIELLPPAPPKLALQTPRRMRVSATGAVRLKVTCTGPKACSGRLRLKAGKTLLGDASCKVKGTKTLTLKLTRRGMKLVRRRRAGLKARLSFVAAKGTSPTTSRTITLLPPRRR